MPGPLIRQQPAPTVQLVVGLFNLYGAVLSEVPRNAVSWPVLVGANSVESLPIEFI